MLVSIVAVLLAAAAFALVGYPLLRERRDEASDAGLPDEYQLALEDLTAQRDATYSAIKELDFDQEMGNLPDADYRELRDRYRRKAATILRDLDELQAGPQPVATPGGRDGARGREAYSEDDLEREILRRRRAGRTAGAGDQPPEGRRVCHACGVRVGPRDSFCRGCGTRVSAVCPNCGAAYHAGDQFCACCGATLAEVAAR